MRANGIPFVTNEGQLRRSIGPDGQQPVSVPRPTDRPWLRDREVTQIFLDFIDANATISLDERTLVVRFQKRAHNPLLVAAGFDTTDIGVPWLGNRRLQFQFG